MTEAELTASLDAHDGLVKSCVESELPIAEFLALYNGFPSHMRLTGIRRLRTSMQFCGAAESELHWQACCRVCVGR
jgi:hypothetical protein